MISVSRIALAAALLGAAFVACNDNFEDASPNGGYATSTEGPQGIIDGDGGPSAAPMLAKIDPSASMVQTPGQGVGVFTQYDPGGHWYVWWTCDTNTSGQSCDFEIKIGVAHGEITGATPQNFQETDLLTGGGAGVTVATVASDAGVEGGTSTDAGANAITPPGSSSLAAEATTTTTVQGVHFDTDPGAVITLSASLGGEYSGSFLFFVEDDKVNGGYTGMLSDPLELQSSSP